MELSVEEANIISAISVDFWKVLDCTEFFKMSHLIVYFFFLKRIIH